MTLTKWLPLTVAVALGALGLSFNTGAADSGAPQRPGRGRFLERAKEKLALTDEQLDQIKAELQADRETLKSLILRLHEARTGLRDAIQAADATEASVRAAAAKVGTAQTELAVERFKLFGRINPILTEEQREKVKQFQAQIDEFVDGAINRLGERLANGQP